MPQSDSAKDYELIFEHRAGYLYAKVTGERDSYAISKAFWQEIADYLKTTEFKRVLVDEDIEEAASLLDVYQLMSELTEMGFEGIRIAFYDHKIDHMDLNEFGELVGSNRGLNGRVFNELKLAENWMTAP